MQGLVCLLAAGCVNPMLVDVQERNVVSADAGEDFEDAETPAESEDARASEPDPQPDAASDAATSIDAARPDDAGRDAGFDAGHDAGLPHDAGSPPTDGGRCKEAGCDAGAPTSGGPCAGGCGDVSVSIGPDNLPLCGNGAPQTCWWTTDPSECSVQCPRSKSCTADAPNVCGTGEYCFFPKGDCGASSAGFCATTREPCGSFTNPVCGCDGVTYKNGCLANKAGTGFADSLHANCK